MRSTSQALDPRLLSAILTPLLLAVCVAPAFADPAMDWVQKMSDAMRNLNYRGYFVYMHENQLESMKIAHYRDDSGEKEHLLSLNGEAREVIRDNQNLTCIWPSSREIVIDLSRKNNYSPIFIPEDIARLEKFYDMNIVGMDRIAGEETMVVNIEPRDQYRYGIKFWINRDNHLMMKSSLVDDHQREIEQVMFTSLSLFEEGEKLVIDSMPKIEDDYHMVRYHRDTDTTQIKLDSAWQIDDVPGGFWRESVLMRKMPDTGAIVRQLVYTDGLASLSIFIERQTDDTMQGSTSMGAVNAFIRILADYSITAIGEVPAITVKHMAEAVSYHGQ